MKKPTQLTRRDFLKLSSTTLALSLTAPEIVLADEYDEDDDKHVAEARVRRNGFSILQGLTTHDSTQLTVDVPREMKVKYRFFDALTGREFEPYYATSVSRDFSGWRVDKLGYEGLDYPGHYTFQVLDNKGKVLDERFLKTLDLQRRDVRFALLSCMLDWSLVKKGMWESLQAARPDLLFFLGDNVYGDLGLRRGPKLLWKRYIKTRRAISFYHWKQLVPVVATWDDHDYGLNDAGGAYGHKDDSVSVFRAFFAQENRDGVLVQGPGVSSVFFAFGQQFVFADNRYYRRLPSPFGGLSFWGPDQVNFVFSQLQPQAGPVWVMQGSQFFGGANKKKDTSFENRLFEAEFAIVRQGLRNLNAPVIFGSGDIHRSEVISVPRDQLGFKTLELTSSSMHSFPNFTKPSDGRVSHAIMNENFLLVDLVPSPGDLRLEVTGIGRKRRVHFQLEQAVG